MYSQRADSIIPIELEMSALLVDVFVYSERRKEYNKELLEI